MEKEKVVLEDIRRQMETLPGHLGFYYKNLVTGLTYGVREEEAFLAASVIKFPLYLHILAQAETGQLSLEEKLTVRPRDKMPSCGALNQFPGEVQADIATLCRLMIVISDNTATNEIIDVVGMERIRQFCLDHGFTNTWIWRKIFYQGCTPPPQVPEGMPYNATTAGDLGRMLEQLADGTLVDEASCRKIIQIMANQRIARLKTLLPYSGRADPREEVLRLPEEGHVVVASKGGTLETPPIAHDAGIFYLPDGRYYVVTICTCSSSLEETTKIINEVGRVIYEAMK